MAWTTYDSFLVNQLSGANPTDFDGDTIKCKICTSSYSPTRASDSAAADATNEVSGTNYTTGGETVTGISVDASGNTVSITASNVVIAQSAGGFSDGRVLVLVDSTNDKLIAYETRGADFGNVSGQLTLNFSDGLLDFNPNP
jgi:hypothetical protein